MKANRFVRVLSIAAATALTTTGLAAVAVSPAEAVVKSNVTILEFGQITSLNPLAGEDNNTTYNSDVAYLTGSGFLYYDNNPTLKMNTKFGTMKVVKKAAHDFQIKYTITPGQKWSDGTPIDAVDLLLSHVITSDKYSAAAGLGNPTNGDSTAFNSINYGGPYAEHVVGDPVLSADHMSITVKFDQPMPDWQLLAPGASPVHALELLAAGKTKLGTASANLAAKAKFLSDFKTKNTASLRKLGDKWSNAYNIANVSSSTNPLLLISNGGFIVKKATAGSSMTFVRNPLYNSGPAMATTNPIKTIVLKVIEDNFAAVQAIRNGDLDIYYNHLPSGADKSALAATAKRSNLTVITKVAGGYSHLELRVGTAFGKTGTYTGPFAGDGQKAKDLRHAFLLALPRQQIVDTLIKPVMSNATPMDTQFAFSGSTEYNTITKASGVAEYSAGTQAQRTARALALVKKWYPSAAAGSDSVSVHIVHANSPVRNNIAALLIAEERKAGFHIVDTADSKLYASSDNQFDVNFFGYSLNSISQANSTALYQTDGGNNIWGYGNAAMDKLTKSLSSDYLTTAEVTAKRVAADKIVHDNYWGLPLYQNPTIAAYTNKLKNVKPAPIGQNIVWNYWEWHY